MRVVQINVITMPNADALMAYSNGTKTVQGEFATAGIWSTYPAEYLDGSSAFGDLVSLCVHNGAIA